MARLDDIRRSVIESVHPLPAETVDRALAGGRWLAETAVAAVAAPPLSCSAMDGFALRAEDLTPAQPLQVAFTVYAGDPVPAALRRGEAARIYTGAPVPENAAAVVPQEAARVEGDRVAPKSHVTEGANIRRAGEDVAPGQVALEPGRRLNPRALGLCAAVGVDALRVTRAPRVALIATGDEVVRGRTPDSNGASLVALLDELGAEVTTVAVGDDLDDLERALRTAASGADAVITIGGVSVGAKDLVPTALAHAGATVRVHGAPMKPGKPFLFATLGSTAVFGLPGSPSACLVAFEVFARPALLRMSGAAHPFRPVVKAPLGEVLEGRAGRDRFAWARLDDEGRVWPLGRDSAQVRGPAVANVLLRVRADTGDVAAGEAAEAWLLES
jgi:molybdopterin molybdotransferase